MTSSPFSRGIFTLSLDFELVWGSRDLSPELAPLLHLARVTRDQVFDPLLAGLSRQGIVATWATVGHLFLDHAARVGGVLHPDVIPPRHAWRPGPWFADVPAGSEADHPEFYARSLVLRLRDAGQEIGSHSFSHAIFGDPGCSSHTAETEVSRCVQEAAALGISLKSFVFPRNIAGHHDVVARHGFTCWRGLEPVWYRHPHVPSPAERLAHLADVALAGEPPTVLPFRDVYGMWCIPASASFFPMDGVRRAIPLSRRVRRCLRGLDAAARDRRVFHLWFHPINLAADPEPMLKALGEVFQHAVRLRDAGRIDILSMGQLAERMGADQPRSVGARGMGERGWRVSAPPV